jgi:hypothetical protein
MYGMLIKKYIEFHKNPFDTTGVFFSEDLYQAI